MTPDSDTRAAELTLREFARHFQPSPLETLDDVPEAPDDKPVNRRLMALEVGSLVPLPEPQAVDVVRAEILQTLHDYANTRKAFRLLVSAPAGIGKSHQGIAFVQERAAMGERWLWAAQNHSMFDDLSAQPNFKAELWYHWQPMDGEIDDAPACRYPAAQHEWTARGYRAWHLCRQLCQRNETPYAPIATAYIDECPYRTQGLNKQWPIVFGMHQHLYSGLEAGKFDGVVVDESFISLIAKEKYIPGKDLAQGSIHADVIALADKLTSTWLDIRNHTLPGFVAGKRLLDAVGPLYIAAATKLQELDETPQLQAAAKHYRNPPVSEPGQVNGLQTIYMDELCTALYPEYQAWTAGRDYWAERVWLDKDGLHFVTPAALWPELPRKIVVLDATGRAGFYQYALGGAVEEYRPNLLKIGRVFQVTGRQNGKTTAIDKTPARTPRNRAQKWDKDLSAYAKEFAVVVRELVAMRGYKNIAVITFQDAEKLIAADLNLPAARVMHFYKLRGRNDLRDCDALFVYGTPSPQERTVTNIMLALDPRRIEPIYQLDADGGHRPIYVPLTREFRLSADGLAQWQAAKGPQYQAAARYIGSYRDPMAAAIQAQMREAELLQAIYRARLITNPADVWVFSSVPTEEALDGLYDDPPIAPGKVGWKLWLKVHAWCCQRAETGLAFGYAELAEGIGSREDYLRSLKVLDAIQEFYGADVERVRLSPDNLKKSRPRELLRLGSQG
jgi:hypothetical protein